MVDLDRTISALRARRDELLNQLDAVQKALAAAEEAESPVVSRRVKPAKVLSEEHRQALIEGGRKARHSRAASAGHARELLDPTPGLAPASQTAAPPRLVKRKQHASLKGRHGQNNHS
jgi:hypothetical protein